MSRSSDTLIVKGRRDSLLIIADPDAPMGQVLADLLARLDGTPAFFRGARMILDMGPRALVAEDLDQLLTILTRYDVTLTTLLTADAATRQLAQDRSLATTLRVSQPARRIRPTTDEQDAPCVVVRRTLRSGQVVKHPGHVIIVGDVNPGAEVLAGGDVFIWGRLRGVVHAGATGDTKAIVCALDLAPSQLRIAGLAARTPEERPHPVRPEIARVEDESIVVETWGGE